MSQQWIHAGERSGFQTHIAETESVSLGVPSAAAPIS
jgi:hypothetical protein